MIRVKSVMPQARTQSNCSNIQGSEGFPLVEPIKVALSSTGPTALGIRAGTRSALWVRYQTKAKNEHRYLLTCPCSFPKTHSHNSELFITTPSEVKSVKVKHKT